MIKPADQWLRCVECGKQFLWDEGEQAWYRMRNFVNPPKRCKKCREQRGQIPVEKTDSLPVVAR